MKRSDCELLVIGHPRGPLGSAQITVQFSFGPESNGRRRQQPRKPVAAFVARLTILGATCRSRRSNGCHA